MNGCTFIVYYRIFLHKIQSSLILLLSFTQQVFDYDRFSRNDVVGEMRVNMMDLDITSSIEIWGEITKNKKVCLMDV